MLVDKQNELQMSDVLFTIHQHAYGGDDVTWKPTTLLVVQEGYNVKVKPVIKTEKRRCMMRETRLLAYLGKAFFS